MTTTSDPTCDIPSEDGALCDLRPAHGSLHGAGDCVWAIRGGRCWAAGHEHDQVASTP